MPEEICPAADERGDEAQVAAARAAAARGTGLSQGDVLALRAVHDLNELPEKRDNGIILFLSFFCGPMPCMIWVAIIIQLAKACIVGDGWVDFAVLCALQLANAVVGFVEVRSADEAIAALRGALQPVAYALRGGAWVSLAARELVPGDVILCKLGDVVPADAILLDGMGPLQVDQSALTGESLPVNKNAWERLLTGSAVKRGEARAMVVDTGVATLLGRAAGLLASVKSQGHLQRVIHRTTTALLLLSLVLCAAIFAKLLSAPVNALHVTEGASRVIAMLSVVIVILVASIPIASAHR